MQYFSQLIFCFSFLFIFIYSSFCLFLLNVKKECETKQIICIYFPYQNKEYKKRKIHFSAPSNDDFPFSLCRRVMLSRNFWRLSYTRGVKKMIIIHLNYGIMIKQPLDAVETSSTFLDMLKYSLFLHRKTGIKTVEHFSEYAYSNVLDHHCGATIKTSNRKWSLAHSASFPLQNTSSNKQPPLYITCWNRTEHDRLSWSNFQALNSCTASSTVSDPTFTLSCRAMSCLWPGVFIPA